MEIRDAKERDAETIGRVARASLAESYGALLDDDTIDAAVEEWYADDRVGEMLAEDGTVLQVADDDGVVGFAQGQLLQAEPLVGEIHWLHVAPDVRGRGVGVKLLGRTQETFERRGAELLRGMVLAGNEDGTAFYEGHGFDRASERQLDIGGDSFEEYVYEKHLGDEATEAVVEARDHDGREVYVNFSEAERGTHGPMYAVFTSRDLDEPYGYYCGNCNSLDLSMDGMERIVCSDCGNERKATRWDASYL